MPFGTVLTVTGLTQGEGDLGNAVARCEEAKAHLSVLVVVLAAPRPVGEYAAVASDAWMEERRADLEALQGRTVQVSQCLASTSISTDVASEYTEVAWADDAIGRRGRHADITVVWPDLPAGGTLKSKAIEGALFSSGKPLLLVPNGWRATFSSKRIMVAWDSRLEAARAVRECLDMLEGAEEVRLVSVDPVESESGHGAEPGADAAAYLARHGAKVTVDRLPSEGHTIAEVLRRHAVHCAADR